MTHSAKTRHYTLWCLAARTTAFCALLFYALAAPDQFLTDLHWPLRCSPLTVVWGLLMVSMVMRLFPSRVESLGCQKVFARRHRPTGKAPEVSSIHRANRSAALVALVWVCGNALVFFWCVLRGSTACATLSVFSFSVPSRLSGCTTAAAPPAASMTGTI